MILYPFQGLGGCRDAKYAFLRFVGHDPGNGKHFFWLVRSEPVKDTV